VTKALFINSELDSGNALYNIMHFIATQSTQLDVTHFRMRDDKFPYNIDDFDVVLYESPHAGPTFENKFGVRPKKRVTFFHIVESGRHYDIHKAYLDASPPDKVLVTDQRKYDIVKSMGYDPVIVPFTFNPLRFKHLPYPTRFTIGYMGANYAHKRFDAVDRIGHICDIPVVGSRRVDSNHGDFVGNEIEFYRQISCYVCTSWDESGPLPPIEALLCGRPIVATDVGMMPYLASLNKGVIVTNFYGISKAVLDVKYKFDKYAEEARKFVLPDTTADYERVLLEVADV